MHPCPWLTDLLCCGTRDAARAARICRLLVGNNIPAHPVVTAAVMSPGLTGDAPSIALKLLPRRRQHHSSSLFRISC